MRKVAVPASKVNEFFDMVEQEEIVSEEVLDPETGLLTVIEKKVR